MPFILALLKLITAGKGIGDTIAKLQQQKLAAANDGERMDIDLRIASLKAQADIQKGSVIDEVARATLALPIEIFLWKVIVWDKVLGLGVTDKLDTNLWYVVMMVLGFYFVTSAVGKRA